MINKILGSVLAVSLISGCSAPETVSQPINEVATIESSPFDKPWPTRFTQKELSNRALEKAYALYEDKKIPDYVDELTVYEEDTVPEGQGECAEISATRILYAFEDFLSEDFRHEDHSLVIGTTPEWVAEKVVATGADLPNQQFIDGSGSQTYEEWILNTFQNGNVLGIAEDFVIILGTDLSADCKWMGYFASHETFHMIHSSIDNRSLMDVRPGIDDRMAAWFYEGAAEFVAYSIESFYGNRAYLSPSFLNKPGGLKSHEPLDAPQSLYVQGHAAIEYLVANAGIESVMQVFTNIGSGDNFKEAFEGAIGMSLEEFYTLFDSLEISPS